MTKKKNHKLSLDDKICKLTEDLLSANVTFYPSNSELEFLRSSLEKRIEGDDQDNFFLIETDGEVEAIELYSKEHCFSCKHKALVQLIRENPDKLFIGSVNDIELPDANHPILQVAFMIVDKNIETDEENENLDDFLDEEDDDFYSSTADEDDFSDQDDENNLDEIDTYSIEDVWVKGFAHLTNRQKDYVRNDIKVGDRVFLRHEFDNPVDTKVYDQVFPIGNGLYKMFHYGNKRSTVKTIENQVKRLDFINNKIADIVDIIEINN